MLFSLLKHYLDTDTDTLKVSHSVYCFTTSISHGVENPRLWGTRLSNAIFYLLPPSTRLCFRLGLSVRLFVCLFVNKITQKLMD